MQKVAKRLLLEVIHMQKVGQLLQVIPRLTQKDGIHKQQRLVPTQKENKQKRQANAHTPKALTAKQQNIMPMQKEREQKQRVLLRTQKGNTQSQTIDANTFSEEVIYQTHLLRMQQHPVRLLK